MSRDIFAQNEWPLPRGLFLVPTSPVTPSTPSIAPFRLRITRVLEAETLRHRPYYRALFTTNSRVAAYDHGMTRSRPFHPPPSPNRSKPPLRLPPGTPKYNKLGQRNGVQPGQPVAWPMPPRAPFQTEQRTNEVAASQPPVKRSASQASSQESFRTPPDSISDDTEAPQMSQVVFSRIDHMYPSSENPPHLSDVKNNPSLASSSTTATYKTAFSRNDSEGIDMPEPEHVQIIDSPPSSKSSESVVDMLTLFVDKEVAEEDVQKEKMPSQDYIRINRQKKQLPRGIASQSFVNASGLRTLFSDEIVDIVSPDLEGQNSDAQLQQKQLSLNTITTVSRGTGHRDATRKDNAMRDSHPPVRLQRSLSEAGPLHENSRRGRDSKAQLKKSSSTRNSMSLRSKKKKKKVQADEETIPFRQESNLKSHKNKHDVVKNIHQERKETVPKENLLSLFPQMDKESIALEQLDPNTTSSSNSGSGKSPLAEVTNGNDDVHRNVNVTGLRRPIASRNRSFIEPSRSSEHSEKYKQKQNASTSGRTPRAKSSKPPRTPKVGDKASTGGRTPRAPSNKPPRTPKVEDKKDAPTPEAEENEEFPMAKMQRRGTGVVMRDQRKRPPMVGIRRAETGFIMTRAELQGDGPPSILRENPDPKSLALFNMDDVATQMFLEGGGDMGVSPGSEPSFDEPLSRSLTNLQLGEASRESGHHAGGSARGGGSSSQGSQERTRSDSRGGTVMNVQVEEHSFGLVGKLKRAAWAVTKKAVACETLQASGTSDISICGTLDETVCRVCYVCRRQLDCRVEVRDGGRKINVEAKDEQGHIQLRVTLVLAEQGTNGRGERVCTIKVQQRRGDAHRTNIATLWDFYKRLERHLHNSEHNERVDTNKQRGGMEDRRNGSGGAR